MSPTGRCLAHFRLNHSGFPTGKTRTKTAINEALLWNWSVGGKTQTSGARSERRRRIKKKGCRWSSSWAERREPRLASCTGGNLVLQEFLCTLSHTSGKNMHASKIDTDVMLNGRQIILGLPGFDTRDSLGPTAVLQLRGSSTGTELHHLFSINDKHVSMFQPCLAVHECSGEATQANVIAFAGPPWNPTTRERDWMAVWIQSLFSVY